MLARTLHPASFLLVLATACNGDPGADAATSAPATTDAVETGTTEETGTSDTTDTDESGTTTGTDDTDDTDDTDTGTDDPETCIDFDQDGYGPNCDLGPDCDDTDPFVHTEMGCAECMDADGDGWWDGCDLYSEDKPGPDCDDNDYNVFTPSGCAECSDDDMDGSWVGCDWYNDDKPGPDCDDDNPLVGSEDTQELCNGLSDNCSGEIDNAPPDEMCPPEGVDPPNVAPMGGWCCDPPAPGVDGCCIQACVDQFFDLDAEVANGCECAGTPRTDSVAACVEAPAGALGSVGEGEQLQDLVVGSIPILDDGIGPGGEDWFWVVFPQVDPDGQRPNAGIVQIDFAQNDDNDYRFEVFRSCNGVAFAGGLATAFGVGAPPVLEWWFFDNHPLEPGYANSVQWPEKVYIRVFRVKNDMTCNHYQLRIERVPD